MGKAFENFDNEIKKEEISRQGIDDTFLSLINQLSLEGNYEIIDNAAGQDGTAADLAEKLLKFEEKLGNKPVAYDSSLQDILGNIEGILGIINLVKKHGLKEEYKDRISRNIAALKNYIELLLSDPAAEKAELGKGFFKHNKIQEAKTEYIKKLVEERKRAA